MLLDENQDLFNTPTLMYYSLKKEFDRKYLNLKLWKHEYGTKESIRSYDDLLRYLEKTEEFRDLDNSLKTSIPSDNVHLVLYVTRTMPSFLFGRLATAWPDRPSILCQFDWDALIRRSLPY